MGALALATLMLVTACATGAPTEYRYRSSESDANDQGQGEALFTRLPTNFAPVQVSESELTAALTTLWLDMPLRVATSRPPLYVGRRLALASVSLSGEAWPSGLAQSYRQFCEQCGTPGDCLTLFEDGPSIQDDDKRSIALALAVRPALEGVDAEVRAMIDPTRVLAMLSVTLVVYMGMLLAPVPEPVTKGLAVGFTVLRQREAVWRRGPAQHRKRHDAGQGFAS